MKPSPQRSSYTARRYLHVFVALFGFCLPNLDFFTLRHLDRCYNVGLGAWVGRLPCCILYSTLLCY